MTDRLVAIINGRDVGSVEQAKNGRLSLLYDSQWRSADESYPISLSLPLAAGVHGHEPVHAFLWGLLPDNDRILEAWARNFGVSPRNPFRLLASVGEDCAGAVQFVTPERAPAFRKGRTGRVQWLTERDVAERLRALGVDEAAWRAAGDQGQFSLAGAQPKTALLLQNGRWGVPAGRTPTTHILKPPSREYDGFAENEHLCLELAKALGLPAASSRVQQFEDQLAIVVERYDRVSTKNGIVRVHQEDLCQAFGFPPTRKYESDGGPSVRQVVDLLRANSRAPLQDVKTFLDTVALSWIIGATDAHGKNYSILIGAAGAVRLAPLYDLASALPYPSLSPYQIKLAMKVGGEYLLRRIGRRQWEKLALEVRVPTDEILRGVSRLAEEVPDRMTEVRELANQAGLRHPMISRLTEAVVQRARACYKELDRGSGKRGVLSA